MYTAFAPFGFCLFEDPFQALGGLQRFPREEWKCVFAHNLCKVELDAGRDIEAHFVENLACFALRLFVNTDLDSGHASSIDASFSMSIHCHYNPPGGMVQPFGFGSASQRSTMNESIDWSGSQVRTSSGVGFPLWPPLPEVPPEEPLVPELGAEEPVTVPCAEIGSEKMRGGSVSSPRTRTKVSLRSF